MYLCFLSGSLVSCQDPNNMISRRFTITLALLLVLVAGCGKKKVVSKKSARKLPEWFAGYWSTSLTEVSTYELQQARFGNVYEGEAYLSFSQVVYSRARQIAAVNIDTLNKDQMKTLQLVGSRSYKCGNQWHALSQMVVMPQIFRDGPYALKIAASVNDLNGISYAQLNLDANKYLLQVRNPDNREGDQNRVVQLTMTEDQIWCMMRIYPDSLPTGGAFMLPGLLSTRLRNEMMQPLAVKLSLHKAELGELPPALQTRGLLKVYTIDYPVNGRTLQIYFNAAPPHLIEGWKDSYQDSGTSSRWSHTIAIRTSTKTGSESGFTKPTSATVHSTAVKDTIR